MKRRTMAAAAAGLLMGICLIAVGCGQAVTGGDRMAGSEGQMSSMEEGHMGDGAMSVGKMDNGKMNGAKMEGGKMDHGKMSGN